MIKTMKKKYLLTQIIILGIFLSLLIISTYLNTNILSGYNKVLNDTTLKTSAPGPDIIIKKTWTIERFEDDAWTHNAGTNYTSQTLLIGGHQNAGQAAQRRLCLRWNVSIPKNARIIEAYINLTVESTTSYNGFGSAISAFDSSSTPPFDDTIENIRLTRPKTSEVTSAIPSVLSENQTIQTADIASILQIIVNRNDWHNNSIFGVYIRPTATVTQPNEMIEFWSYDAGNLNFTPQLFVEWEETPYFMTIPSDMTIQNATRGYHIEWTPGGRNPNVYAIVSNVSGVVQQGNWTSGIEISHNLPPLDTGVYLYIMIINDDDGNWELDSLIINVIFLDLPVITNIKFIQNYEERTYFKCGDGPFTVQIYNNTPFNVDLDLRAYYENYNLTFVAEVLGTWMTLVLDPYSFNTLSYSLVYNYSFGCFQLTPLDSALYQWYLPVPFFGPFFNKYVNSIEYKVINIFIFDVNSGAEYIYNQTIYGGVWGCLTLEVENKDLTAPKYFEPVVLIPESQAFNIEIQAISFDEAFGSGIDKAILYYSINNGPWESTKMQFLNGIYQCSIPPRFTSNTIRYYINFSDYAGNFNTTSIFTFSVRFEETSILVPLIGIFIGIIGVISISLYYHHKNRIIIIIPPTKDEIKMYFRKLERKKSKVTKSETTKIAAPPKEEVDKYFKKIEKEYE